MGMRQHPGAMPCVMWKSAAMLKTNKTKKSTARGKMDACLLNIVIVNDKINAEKEKKCS
jgi:hypothetical protein